MLSVYRILAATPIVTTCPYGAVLLGEYFEYGKTQVRIRISAATLAGSNIAWATGIIVVWLLRS
jgi:hypothetical protein